MPVADRIRKVLALDPGATAIAFDDQAYSWSYLSAVVEGMDLLLDGADEGAGAAVGLIMRNGPAHVATLAASIVTGRCLVTLSPMFSDEALSDDVRGLGLHAILGDARDLARPGVAEAATAAGVTIIEVGSDRHEPLRRVRESALARVARRRPEVVLEMLSSGTTGVPKRISLTAMSLELSLSNDDAHAKSADEGVRLQKRPALIWHPMVHVSGVYFVIDALYSGRTIILMERFDVRRWAQLVEREGVRVGHLNPTAMRMVLEADVRPEQLASLKVVRGGTAATPPELQVAFEERYGVPVLTTYGATEFAGAVVGWTLDDHRAFGRSRLGASGRAHPGVELRIVDALTGAELAIGETGVLEVRTAQASADPPTWVRTTDLAAVDADGFLWIKGRVDDVIVRGGFKVHPAKVVAALEEHPEVGEAAVVGVADERLGELPVAAVTLRHGREALDVEELAGFVRTRLAAYEVPGRIIVVDELPMTPSMKVNRLALRALFATR
jgi:acyl-coenzyme A synthetase/AMP-(fatty) acid ligase